MTEPKRYTDMTQEERIEAANKAAVFEWWEQQTKGEVLPNKQKKEMLNHYKRALDEILKRLDNPMIATLFEKVPYYECRFCPLDCPDPWNNPNKKCPKKGQRLTSKEET